MTSVIPAVYSSCTADYSLMTQFQKELKYFQQNILCKFDDNQMKTLDSVYQYVSKRLSFKALPWIVSDKIGLKKKTKLYIMIDDAEKAVTLAHLSRTDKLKTSWKFCWWDLWLPGSKSDNLTIRLWLFPPFWSCDPCPQAWEILLTFC